MLGDQLGDELLLPSERHALHGLIKAHFVHIWHALRHFVELLLKFLAVLERLGEHLFLCFLVVLLLLLGVHGLDHGFDGWTDFLKAIVGLIELLLAQILGILEPLEVVQGLVERDHCLLLLRQQVASCERLTLAQQLGSLGPKQLHETCHTALLLYHL